MTQPTTPQCQPFSFPRFHRNKFRGDGFRTVARNVLLREAKRIGLMKSRCYILGRFVVREESNEKRIMDAIGALVTPGVPTVHVILKANLFGEFLTIPFIQTQIVRIVDQFGNEIDTDPHRMVSRIIDEMVERETAKCQSTSQK